jgi:hypothetical protein
MFFLKEIKPQAKDKLAARKNQKDLKVFDRQFGQFSLPSKCGSSRQGGERNAGYCR